MRFLLLNLSAQRLHIRAVCRHLHLYTGLQAVICEACAMFAFNKVHVGEHFLTYIC